MTSDNVTRIFMPVIDAPSHLQLHASVDRWSFQIGDPEPSRDEHDDEADIETPIFWLDRAAFLSGDVHHHEAHNSPDLEESRRRKLKEFADDDWELFAYITKNGSFVVRALTVRNFPGWDILHADRSSRIWISDPQPFYDNLPIFASPNTHCIAVLTFY